MQGFRENTARGRVSDEEDDFPGIDPEILARAEQAVAALGADFIVQTQEALNARRALLESAVEPPQGDALRDIFAFAHDLRGQGGSFGYPLLSEIGGSLCAFVEARDFQLANGDTAVLQSHLDAAAAIVADDIAGDGDSVSRALVESLIELVGKRLGDTA